MTLLEKTNMLMMFRALKYTIYEKIALGDRIPLTQWETLEHILKLNLYSN